LREGHASLTLVCLALVLSFSPLYYQRLCVSTRGDAQGQQVREKFDRDTVGFVEHGKCLCLDRCELHIDYSKRKTPQLAGQQNDWNSQSINLL
jgi:hypothetical protein